MTVYARVQLWIWVSLFMWVVFGWGMYKALAHDVYSDLHSNSGQLCCGGDPTTGDCEPLAFEQFQVNIDGSVTIRSTRYGATVLIDPSKVTWLPVAGSDAPAHWCGKKRGTYAYDGTDQPDPTYWTFCTFIAPGGV
jgi:hypothetical protein